MKLSKHTTSLADIDGWQERMRLAVRFNVAVTLLRRQASHGPRRWAASYGGCLGYGRTPEAAARALLASLTREGRSRSEVRALLGERYRVEVYDAPETLEELIRTIATSLGLRTIGVSLDDLDRDAAQRGDRRARRRVRRRPRDDSRHASNPNINVHAALRDYIQLNAAGLI